MTMMIPKAQMLHRAAAAARCAVRQTDHRAKLHQGLVKVAGTVLRRDLRKMTSRSFFLFCVRNRRKIVVQPCCDTHNVAVYRRDAQTEADGRDRACGIFSDARQRQKRLIIRRERAAVPLADQLRGPVQIARAAVIAEPLPQLEHLRLIRRGERTNIRKRLHPPLVIAAHGLDARLLEHDLAHPDAVGHRFAPPGQVSVSLVVPLEQRLDDRLRHAAQCFISSSVAPV